MTMATRCVAAEAPRPFRYLSASIAAKQELLTVSFARDDTKSFSFRYLHVPETIEWE